jgi:Methyltransferase domain
VTRLNLGCGPRTINSYDNLDKNDSGWRWENGLGQYPEASVECATSSHTLMYVSPHDWPHIFSEVYRVLIPGGVWRITEDETDEPESNKFGGHVSRGGFKVHRTGLVRMTPYFWDAGFKVYEVGPGETRFTDSSILQDWYRGIADSFFLEGVK